MEEYKKLEAQVLEAAKQVRLASKSGGQTPEEGRLKQQVESTWENTNRQLDRLFENQKLDLANFFQLFRDRKSFIEKSLKELEELATQPLPDLQGKIESFQKQLSHLEEWIETHNKTVCHETDKIKLDWKIRYAAERDPEGKVEFKGGVIKDRFGNPIWLVSCHACGIEIEHGSKGAGTKRMVDEECANINFCLDCWRFRCLCRKFCSENTIDFDQVCRKYLEDDHWDHSFIEENRHAVWLHVDVLEKGNTPATFIKEALAAYSNRKCIGMKTSASDGPYNWLTYQQVQNSAIQLAVGFQQMVLKKSFVGIWAPNRPEWIISDFACAFSDNIVIGLHTTYTLEEIEYIIQTTTMKVLITDTTRIPYLLKIIERCPSLQLILNLDAEPLHVKGIPVDRIYKTFDQFTREHSNRLSSFKITESSPNDRVHPSAPPDLFTIIFTSGSTGQPKGVMQTAHSFLSDISHSLYIFPLVTSSFIPLSHSTDRMRIWETIGNGGRIGFCSYNPKNWEHHESGEKKQGLLNEGTSSTSTNGVEELFNDIRVLRPTVLIAPSRIWTGLMNLYHQRVHQLEQAQKSNNPIASKEDSKNYITPEDEGKAYVKQLLGDRITSIATGGSPTSSKVFEFIETIYGEKMPLLESYGCTEAGGITMNGSLLEHVELKIDPHTQEIKVKTPVMFAGYFGLEEETKKVMEGGYYHTGDLGRVENEKLVILGRLKNALKNAKGEAYDPEELESFFSGSDCVDQICIIGSEKHNSLVAIVVPSVSAVQKFLNKPNPSPQDYFTLPESPPFNNFLSDQLRQFAKEKELSEWKIPVGFVVETQEWTMESGLMTTSFKILRNRIALKYQKQIQALFEKFH